MMRTILVLLAFAALLSACSPEPPGAAQTTSGFSGPSRAGLSPVQLSQRPEITVEKILKDIIGKDVSVQDAAGESQPMEWLFEENEPKNAEILEQKANDNNIALVVQLNTSGAPNSDDANVQLSGK